VSSSNTNNADSNHSKPAYPSARSAPQGTGPARPESSRVDAAAASGVSVIGNDLIILGETITLITQNELQIDGHVQGDVHGKQVMISKEGSVTGKVCAEKIDIRGGVNGFIRALFVALHESAKVDGDIMHQKISISKGAELDGRVQRTKDKNDLIHVLNASAFGSPSGKDPDLSIRGCTQSNARGKRESNKDLVRAFYKRGNAYGRMGAYDRAISNYTNAIKIDPEHAGSYVNRATYYDQKGEYDRAIADYTKALEIRPDNVIVYLKRGLVFQEKDDKEGALADFDKSIKYASADFSYAYFLRGLFHVDMGQFDRAIADYNKAIEIETGLAAFYQSRAEAYAMNGERERAIVDYDKAAELSPKDSARFYLLRGNTYALRGHFEKAFADFNKVMALAPKYALAYRDRGQIYAKMGKTAKAKVDFTRAKELEPRIRVPDLSAAAAEGGNKGTDHEVQF
jgi:tetratricopeptide (TPR) repeat protein